jgi:hypothetical protein
MLARLTVPALAGLLLVLLSGPAVGRTDGIEPSILAPGLLQAREAISRLERLVDEAEAIGTALFRVQNAFGERRASSTDAPDCQTPWLLDLGWRSREFGRAFRDAVQSARVQARRVESLTVQQTVQPLLDPETNHKILALLTRVDDLVRRFPEAAAWQENYLEPLMKGCEPVPAPAPGLEAAVPPLPTGGTAAATAPGARKSPLVAVLAFGGGWLCPGAVPAAGVMLVAGEVCYSAVEACDCEARTVSPATVLGPEAKAGSAN